MPWKTIGLNRIMRESARNESLRMMRFFLIALIAASALAAQVHPEQTVDAVDENTSEGRLWGGNITSYKKHPYFAAITRRNEPSSTFGPMCSGAFVTPQIVITAAHCVQLPLDRIRVRYGINKVMETSGDRSEFGQGFDHRVARIFIHPQYVYSKDTLGPEQSPDIALLRLEVPIHHTSFVLQMPEPYEDRDFIDTDIRTTLVGIGLSFGRDPSHTLKEASINLYRGGSCLSGKAGVEYSRFEVCALGNDGGYRSCHGK